MHEVVLLVTKMEVREDQVYDRVRAVEVDGTRIEMPEGMTLKVEADAGGAGYVVSIPVLAKRVSRRVLP